MGTTIRILTAQCAMGLPTFSQLLLAGLFACLCVAPFTIGIGASYHVIRIMKNSTLKLFLNLVGVACQVRCVTVGNFMIPS